jgi:hypothetical protein
MLVAVTSLAVTACSSFAPVRVNAGEQCFRCRRAILETRLAAELIDRNGFAAKFKAPLCMAKYLAAHPEETGTVYVTDVVTGKMVAPESALFVPIVVNRDTGERDYAAYRYGADADRAASATNTVPRTWAAVREAGE